MTLQAASGPWRRGALALACLAALSGAPRAQDAATLIRRHAELREALASNAFRRPLVLESSEASGDFKGEVHAVIAQPFAVVGPALQGMEQWCEVLILHLNVKGCQSRGTGAAATLSLAVGRKFDQPIAQAFKIDFAYRVVVSRPDYLQVTLAADAGPMDTRNYRLAFEAIPLDATSSFVHMSYAYGYGLAARLAMATYLATIGRDKVGFGIVGRQVDGTPVYRNDMRGAVERNTMRYFLAIEAYLGATGASAAQRSEQRLRDWFDAIERYPRQLHELEREEYLAMKRRELAQSGIR